MDSNTFISVAFMAALAYNEILNVELARVAVKAVGCEDGSFVGKPELLADGTGECTLDGRSDNMALGSFDGVTLGIEDLRCVGSKDEVSEGLFEW